MCLVCCVLHTTSRKFRELQVCLACLETTQKVLERDRVRNGVRPKLRLVGGRRGMHPAAKQHDDQVLQEPLPSILTEAHSLTVANDVHIIDHVLHQPGSPRTCRAR